MIDLHVHTTASDGQYSPSEIMEKAAAAGISVLAITDHDTFSGLEEGRAAADKFGIRFVSGIELNIEWHSGEFHLLGLGFSRISSSLRAVTERLVESRNSRNARIIEKMNQDGVPISMEEMTADFPGTVIGRPHFAAELVKHNVVKNRQQAFDRYLARGKPWYAERTAANLDEAVAAINESGGIPVIAHPMSLYLSWGKMLPALEDIRGRGVEGLEAFHPGARMTDCLRLEEAAVKYGFFVTAGSDFHGEKVRADRKLGHTCGNRKISDSFWTDGLEPALRNRKNSFFSAQ